MSPWWFLLFKLFGRMLEYISLLLSLAWFETMYFGCCIYEQNSTIFRVLEIYLFSKYCIALIYLKFSYFGIRGGE
jgi:hypothetical protein